MLDASHSITQHHTELGHNFAMERIYNRIVEARLASGKAITQDAMAADYGVHQTTVHKWAAGKGDPKPALIRQIAIMEGLCIEWLSIGREPMYPMAPDIAALADLLTKASDADKAEIRRFAEFLSRG